MKKRVISFMMSAVLTLSGLGCYGLANVHAETDTNVERKLKIFAHYAEAEKPILDYAISKVQEKYPNVTFEIEAHPNDDGQTLKTRAATGDMPDIAHVNAGDVESLSASGSLLDVAEYVKDTGYADKMTESAKGTEVYDDGKTYIFPDSGASSILLYYNKKVFEDNNIKVPENYDELLEATKELVADDIIPCALFAKEGFVSGAFFDMFALKSNPAGLKALSEGKAHASDSGYAEGIKKMVDLVNEGFFQAGCTSTDYETAQNLFTSGQAAMFINGDWDISSLVEKMGDDVGYFESYPMADAGKEQDNYYAFSGGFTYEGYAVSSDTEDPELVADIVSILAEGTVEGNYIYQSKIPTVINIDSCHSIIVTVMGALEAVTAADSDCVVVGTDGTSEAVESIKAGELDATVDFFPNVMSQIAVEMQVRKLAGEEVPKVVYAPQSIRDASNADASFEEIFGYDYAPVFE